MNQENLSKVQGKFAVALEECLTELLKEKRFKDRGQSAAWR